MLRLFLAVINISWSEMFDLAVRRLILQWCQRVWDVNKLGLAGWVNVIQIVIYLPATIVARIWGFIMALYETIIIYNHYYNPHHHQKCYHRKQGSWNICIQIRNLHNNLLSLHGYETTSNWVDIPTHLTPGDGAYTSLGILINKYLVVFCKMYGV